MQWFSCTKAPETECGANSSETIRASGHERQNVRANGHASAFGTWIQLLRHQGHVNDAESGPELCDCVACRASCVV